MPVKCVIRPEPGRDLSLAVAAADRLVDYSRNFSRLVPHDLNAAAAVAVQNLPEMMVSATMLSLAIEMYLKVALAAEGTPVPQSHDLGHLWKELSAPPQAAIETRFQRSAGPLHAVTGIELQIKTDNQFPPDGPSKPWSTVREPESASKVLQMAGKGFTTWRYLYEMAEHGAIFEITYDFGRLQRVASAVRDELPQEILRRASNLSGKAAGT